MRIGFRTRIYPTKEQADQLAYYAMCSHKMWNFVVAKFTDDEKAPSIGKYGVNGYKPRDLLNEFEKETGLRKIPERIALDVLMRYADAWERCFAKLGDKPKFHKYNANRQSFCVCSVEYRILVQNIIALPKSGRGRNSSHVLINTTFLQRHGITRITEPRFTCLFGKWYVSGSAEIADTPKKEAPWLGLDWAYALSLLHLPVNTLTIQIL